MKLDPGSFGISGWEAHPAAASDIDASGRQVTAEDRDLREPDSWGSLGSLQRVGRVTSTLLQRLSILADLRRPIPLRGPSAICSNSAPENGSAKSNAHPVKSKNLLLLQPAIASGINNASEAKRVIDIFSSVVESVKSSNARLHKSFASHVKMS